MSARIDIDGLHLTVSMRGFDVVWAARRHIVVPLEHVRGAHVDPHVAREGPWLGAGRTDALLGYAVAAGPMFVRGRREFWDVHHPEKAVAIDLRDEPYQRLVLEVDDPTAMIEMVNEAVTASAAAA